MNPPMNNTNIPMNFQKGDVEIEISEKPNYD